MGGYRQRGAQTRVLVNNDSHGEGIYRTYYTAIVANAKAWCWMTVMLLMQVYEFDNSHFGVAAVEHIGRMKNGSINPGHANKPF